MSTLTEIESFNIYSKHEVDSMLSEAVKEVFTKHDRSMDDWYRYNRWVIAGSLSFGTNPFQSLKLGSFHFFNPPRGNNFPSWAGYFSFFWRHNHATNHLVHPKNRTSHL